MTPASGSHRKIGPSGRRASRRSLAIHTARRWPWIRTRDRPASGSHTVLTARTASPTLDGRPPAQIRCRRPRTAVRHWDSRRWLGIEARRSGYVLWPELRAPQDQRHTEGYRSVTYVQVEPPRQQGPVVSSVAAHKRDTLAARLAAPRCQAGGSGRYDRTPPMNVLDSAAGHAQ